MKKVFHPANTRGEAIHDWLHAKHSFSFANYFDADRIQFGALRVLNDDVISPGMGFGTHPHDNMEIITIPLMGALEHKDSMDNVGAVDAGEIQVMSAGSGVYHSEYNKNKDKDLNLLQLWIFPNKQNVTPRYDQKNIRDLKKINCFYPIITPDQQGPGMWIHQDAWLHLGDFEKQTQLSYELHKKGNGIYIFIIEGNAEIAQESLSKRDALGLWDIETFSITIMPGTRILLIEIPMNI